MTGGMVSYLGRQTYVGRRGRLPSAPPPSNPGYSYDGNLPIPGLPVPVSSATAGKSLITTALLLLGWRAWETSGSATASLVAYDGLDANTGIVAGASLPAGATAGDWFGWPGVLCQIGLYVTAGTGAWQGVFYVAILTEAHGYRPVNPGLVRSVPAVVQP